MQLAVTYFSGERRVRTFDILVDGKRLKEERLERSEPERFLDIGYDLPADLVKGRKKVTIRFEATKGNEIASVFGLRMIRADLPR